MLIEKHLSLNFYILILLNFSLFAQTNIDFETDDSGLNWNWTVADNGNNTPLEFVSNPNITESNSSGTTAKFISSPKNKFLNSINFKDILSIKSISLIGR